jgi:hypothetical protein
MSLFGERCRSIRRLGRACRVAVVAHVLGSCVCCAARPGAAVSPCGLWCGARDSRPPSIARSTVGVGLVRFVHRCPASPRRTSGDRWTPRRLPPGSRESRRPASRGVAGSQRARPAGVLGVFLVARCLRVLYALDVVSFSRALRPRGRVGGNRRVLSSKTRDVQFGSASSSRRPAGESSDVAPGAAR